MEDRVQRAAEWCRKSQNNDQYVEYVLKYTQFNGRENSHHKKRSNILSLTQRRTCRNCSEQRDAPIDAEQKQYWCNQYQLLLLDYCTQKCCDDANQTRREEMTINLLLIFVGGWGDVGRLLSNQTMYLHETIDFCAINDEFAIKST